MYIEQAVLPLKVQAKKAAQDEIGLLKKDKTDRMFESDVYEAPLEIVDSLVLGLSWTEMIETLNQMLTQNLSDAEHLLLANATTQQTGSALIHFEEH